jgi:hypothetical protein
VNFAYTADVYGDGRIELLDRRPAVDGVEAAPDAAGQPCGVQ